VVSTELLLESGSELLLMTGENSIANSSNRGNNAGKETLTYGEFICPLELDYINKDIDSVQAHAISAHHEYSEKEEIREVSKEYRDKPLPGTEDEATQETLTETTEDFNDENEDTTEETVLDEVYDEEVDPEELDSSIQDTLDSLDTVEEADNKTEREKSGGLIAYIKLLFGL